MSRKTRPERWFLRREAEILGALLQRYRSDWEFKTQREDAQVVYFIDAHDLKSYIDPDKPEFLKEFLFDAESPSLDWDNLAAHKLKNEQVLQRLLFKHNKQLGLLPSHAQEIEDELTYQAARYEAGRLSLLVDVESEFRELNRDALKRQLITEGNLGEGASPESRLEAARLLERYAPALRAYLRDQPNTSKARIEALGNESDLVPLELFEWEKLALPAEEADMLRAARPTEEHVSRWRRFLSQHKERRRHSNEANLVDAQAMACLEVLGACLKRLPRSNVRIVLVTRVMSLIRATREPAALQAAGLGDAGAYLRHPRILLLPEVDPKILGEVLDTLVVALETFQNQLDARESSAGADIETARQLFVSALLDFERASFALDFRSEIDGNPPQDKEAEIPQERVRQLLRWFARDAEFDKLIRDEVAASVRRFGYGTYFLGQSRVVEPIEAVIQKKDNPERVSVRAVPASIPGPVEFSSGQLLSAVGPCDDLEELLGKLPAKVSERYLAWALLYSCRQRWKLAEIYSRSAGRVAQLIHSEATATVEMEARLLHAQVRRLGGLEKGATAEGRFREAQVGLGFNPGARDVRILLEGAAQVLELVLTVGEQEGPGRQLADSVELLEAAYGLSRDAQDELNSARCLAYLVLHALVAIRRGASWRRAGDPSSAAHEWHQSLRAVMDSIRDRVPVDKIPRRLLATEIIGFRLDSELEKMQGADQLRHAYSWHQRRMEVPRGLPMELRAQAPELRMQLAAANDQVGRLIASELKQIPELESRPRYRRWQLLFAPVWGGEWGKKVAELLGPDSSARADAEKAYEILFLVAGSERFGIDPMHRHAFDYASRLFTQAAAKCQDELGGVGRAPGVKFYLLMAASFARLLVALATASPAAKEKALRQLATEYNTLAREYPGSAIVHFRLHLIYAELGDRDEESSTPPAERELDLAAGCIGSDPTVPADHWIRSTLQRRLADPFFRTASELRSYFHRDPPSSEVLTFYLGVVRQAFLTVYTDFPFHQDPDPDSRFQVMEAQRRINNVVYGAAMFLEVLSDLKSLHPSFTRKELLRLTRRLHQGGIKNVKEESVVHTIGCVYHVLGEADLAMEAGARFMQLFYKKGISLTGYPRRVSLLEDALMWRREAGLR